MLKITLKKRVNSYCKETISLAQEHYKNIRFLFILLVFFIGLDSIAQKSNLWLTLAPNSGGVSQVDDDITINNGSVIDNNSSSTINCSQSTNGNALIYSISYIGSDFDKDGNNDQVTFDLIVKGYIDATYSYSANQNASSVTNYGTQSNVTVINNTWGVFSDFDVDPGESLVYEIENFTINGVGSGYTYEFDFTLVDLIETNGGRDHTMIFGFGNNLESYEMDSNKSVHPSGVNNSFSVTGAGSPTTATREFAISSLTFNIEINGPDNAVWDVTDYSIFEKGPTMYHDYPVQTEKKTTLPNFSWNKIPRWVAARSTQAFTNQQITDIADNFQLIMLEKANSQGFSYIEDGIENAATRLKAVNPDITTLFYYNTYINYGGYRANIEYNQNAAAWSTYENGEIYLFKDLYYWYNQDVEGMRNWWVDTCLEMANLDVIDGVFIDKVVNPDANGDVLDESKNPVNNYTRMLRDLYTQLPDNKLLVGNTLRNERAGGSRGLMEIMDGSYMERWDFPSSGQSDAEALAVTIQLMREALQKGKMINFQTSPDSSTEEEKPTDPSELLAFTKEHVYFPLAVYLIIAEENAYFSYTTGVNALPSSSDLWDTSFIDEFHYFLGAPLGDPTKNGYLYERSFENLDVSVNLETKETVFDWKDKTINPDSGAVLDTGNVWYHNYSTNDFNAEYITTILGDFETNQATVSTNGNTSAQVSKFTKNTGAHSHIRFNTPNNLTEPTETIFKVRVYTVSNSTITNNNIRIILRKDGDTSTQLSKTLSVTKMDSWEEYTFNFSDVEFTADYYNQINIFFASPDTDDDANGNIYYIDALQGPQGASLSIENLEFNNTINLYPNPAIDSFSLSEKIMSAKIYNMLGQEIMSFSKNQNQYDVSHLKNGFFLIKVLTENGKNRTIRFVKE